MNEYSPEVQAFINEQAAKESQGGGIRLNLPMVRLVGKNPNRDNSDVAGRFFVRRFNEAEKKYDDMEPFGPEPNQAFTGVILDISYYAKWKYAEGSKTTFRTREIHDWSEPVELLKITFGENGGSSLHRRFNSYADFRSAFTSEDSVTGEKRQAPYDLFAAIYVWHPANKEILKYEVKGATRSNFFDYQRKWNQALSEIKTIKNVLTHFGIDRDEKGFIGTFTPKAAAPAETMEEVVRAHAMIKEWQESWKRRTPAPENGEPHYVNEDTPPPTDAPPEMADADEVNLEDIPSPENNEDTPPPTDTPPVADADEVNVEDIPF